MRVPHRPPTPGVSLRAKPSGATGRARLGREPPQRSRPFSWSTQETGSVWPLAIRSEFYHMELVMFSQITLGPHHLSAFNMFMFSAHGASGLALCRPLSLEALLLGKTHTVSILLLKPQSLFGLLKGVSVGTRSSIVTVRVSCLKPVLSTLPTPS